MSLLPQEDESGSRRVVCAAQYHRARCIRSAAAIPRVTAHDVLRYMVLDPDNAPRAFTPAPKAARENAAGACAVSITSEMWEGAQLDLARAAELQRDRPRHGGRARVLRLGEGAFAPVRGVTVGTALKDEAFQFNRLGTFSERSGQHCAHYWT
jgi:uncharacterized alpha-E superfamily protein